VYAPYFCVRIRFPTMFHCADDFLTNLVVLSPKIARKKFRESIFQDWHWKCAYCDAQLCDRTATVDHIIPKHKGGHSTRNNLACCCSSCNRGKASSPWLEWYQLQKTFSEQRVSKIKGWLEQKPCSLKITATEQAVPYLCHDATIGWIAT
jgi:5-methylcytosine-specific restriction endonuclease McrA